MTTDALQNIGELKDKMIATSKFNQGQSARIFEQVQTEGTKIIVKNGKPICVLMPIDEYDELRNRANRGEGEN